MCIKIYGNRFYFIHPVSGDQQDAIGGSQTSGHNQTTASPVLQKCTLTALLWLSTATVSSPTATP